MEAARNGELVPARVLTIVLLYVRRCYPSTQATLPMVCRLWRACVPERDVDPMKAAAEEGFGSLMWKFNSKTPEEYGSLMVCAARGGHFALVRECYVKWDYTLTCKFLNYSRKAIVEAAKGGHLDVIITVSGLRKDRGDLAFELALVEAIKASHRHIVEFLVWGWLDADTSQRFVAGKDYEYIMCRIVWPLNVLSEGVQRGLPEVVRFVLRVWWCSEPTNLGIEVGLRGDIEVLQVCIDEYDEFNVRQCFMALAQGGHTDTIRYLWDNYPAFRSGIVANDILENGARFGHLDVMRLAKEEYGADDFDRARAVSGLSGRLRCLEVVDLLLSWETRNYTCGDGRAEEPPLKRSRHP